MIFLFFLFRLISTRIHENLDKPYKDVTLMVRDDIIFPAILLFDWTLNNIIPRAMH